MPNKDVCAARRERKKSQSEKGERPCWCVRADGEQERLEKKRCFPCVAAAAAAAAAANNNETECEAWNSVELALGNTVVVSSPRKTLAN